MLALRGSVLVVLALGLACSGEPGCTGSKHVEGPPARPCSINGMLFRDTPDVDFQQCGSSSLPLDGEVVACVKAALADQRPFVVQISGGGFDPRGDGPALVGAHFEGGYGVRMYIARGDTQGERTELQFVVTNPGSETLSTTVTNLKPYRCRMETQMPQGDDWVHADEHARRMVDAQDCVEWFDETQWRRQPWDSRHEAASVLRCGAEAKQTPASTTLPSLEDDVRRYVDDPAYRRAVLERDLTDRAPLYARARLARYSKSGDKGWETLSVRRWETAPLSVDDARAMKDTDRVPSDVEFSALDYDDPATWPKTDAEWVALGERVFFEYPFSLSAPIGEALRRGAALEDYGLMAYDGDYVGVRVARHDARPAHLAVTCAVCHASIGADGRPSAVRANRNYDFARLRIDGRAEAHEGGIDVTRFEDLSRLGPGRSDVQHDDTFNPYAFPDMGGIKDVPFLHHTANWRHAGTVTMAIRVETVFTRGGERGWRPPRVLMWALAKYFRSLPPPPPVREPDELSAAGQGVFEREDCDMCHAPPLFTADAPVDLDEIGTDAAAGTSKARGTGTWRVPSLRGVGGNAPYLHHGAFGTLEAMFAPGRQTSEPGHEFGLDLDEDDRSALLAYLRTI